MQFFKQWLKQNAFQFIPNSYFTFKVLVVLSRIHDPIDGEDLSASPVIEDHITQLLSSSGQPKPVPQFACFSCPASSGTLKEFSEHVKSQKHLLTAFKSGKWLMCDVCNKTFENFNQISMHTYSRSHQVFQKLFQVEVLHFK